MGKIILGITGSIAAYKGVEVLREFQKRKWDVIPVMTKEATHFISPLTLQSLSGNKVIVDQFEDVEGLEHINLCKQAQGLVIAPATANIIAKMANGIADDFLTSLYLACDKRVFIAPAMNQRMYLHPATQRNIDVLKKDGVLIIEPERGYLACEDEGIGRLADPPKIVFRVISNIASDLRGIKILVSAGPTREYIDDIRFISNPSTGKQGMAIAEEASLMGADVTLLLSEASMLTPMVKTERFNSHNDLLEKILKYEFDILFMTAAVGDFVPYEKIGGKIPRKGELILKLKASQDLLKEIVRRKEGVIVAFAAETENFVEKARKKLKKKGVDLIFVNPVGKDTGFASDKNRGWLVWPDGRSVEIKEGSKNEVARKIIIEALKILKEVK